MAILHSTEITQDSRRTIIRELANISAAKYSDDELDSRIENWDEVSRTYFQAQGLDLDGTENYYHNLITVSNLLTSIAILNGIGGSDNLARLKEQTTLFKSIVAAQNRKEVEQNEFTTMKTNGINGSKRGTFG